MPLDPVIAQGFRGIQLENPVENYMRLQQMQSAQQQNQLNALKMQEYQREVETTNRLRSLDPKSPGYIDEVTRINPQIGSELQLRRSQQSAATRAEAASAAEARSKNLTYWQTLARDSARTPTDEVVSALARRAVELEVTDEATAVSQLQEILRMPLDQRSQVLSQYGAAAAAAPATPADIASMKALGFPLTQAGYEQFRAAQRQERMLSPEEEQQRIRIAQASRPPPQPREPREPSAPVAVVDDATGTVKYVTREEAVGKTPANAIEGLTPRERQKREAALPQATSSVKSFEYKTDQFIKELIKLRDDPGLDQITGPVYGRTPSVSREGSRAQAAYNKIFAKGGFQALQDLREASKTGGALGNVSNQEGERLERSVVGGLDRTQNKKDVQNGINDFIADLKVSKERVRAAFDDTYQYKQGGAAAPTTKPSLDSIFGPKK
jgi:hypothetical protein